MALTTCALVVARKGTCQTGCLAPNASSATMSISALDSRSHFVRHSTPKAGCWPSQNSCIARRALSFWRAGAAEVFDLVLARRLCGAIGSRSPRLNMDRASAGRIKRQNIASEQRRCCRARCRISSFVVRVCAHVCLSVCLFVCTLMRWCCRAHVVSSFARFCGPYDFHMSLLRPLQQGRGATEHSVT